MTFNDPTYLALILSVVTDPSDDVSRLVLADWLEENGGPDGAEWARFIREMIEKPHARVTKSEGSLVLSNPKAPGYRMVADLLDMGVTRVGFHRGFIEHVELPAAVLRDRAADIFSRHPVVSARLTDYEWFVDAGPCPPFPHFLKTSMPAGMYMYEFDALKDLNDSCVRYGRDAAGLSALVIS
jgi:uncharacterized protein (TIGR02996 family)